MAILTVYATSCVSSYDINVAIMDDKDRLIKICEVLNKFSGSLPDLDVYSKLGDFLCNPNWVEVFYRLCVVFSQGYLWDAGQCHWQKL